MNEEKVDELQLLEMMNQFIRIIGELRTIE